jgi:hypothetical protein
MTTASGNAISSSGNSQKIRVDFYESGIGETIVVTLPCQLGATAFNQN